MEYNLGLCVCQLGYYRSIFFSLVVYLTQNADIYQRFCACCLAAQNELCLSACAASFTALSCARNG